MKSYTFDDYDSKDFINFFTYDKERNLIVLHYATGKVLPVNCNKENMKKVLEKMKYQVENSKDFERALRKKFNVAVLMTSLAGFMLLVSCFMASSSIILGVLSILTLYLGTSIMKDSNTMLVDIEKNRFFLEHSEEIDSAVKSLTKDEASYMIENNLLPDLSVSNDTLSYMNQEDVPVVNLNSIDKCTKEDIEEIIDYLEVGPKKILTRKKNLNEELSSGRRRK